MTTAQGGYAPISKWVKPVLGSTHTTVVVTVAWAVRCLRVAPRIPPAALARAVPGAHAGSGRACLRRVRRWWSGPTRDPTTLRPTVLRLALTLRPSGHAVVVARAPTRLGPWAVWLAGLVVAGRPLPIGWAVSPSPWPQGRFRTTTVALLPRLQAAFPAGVRWPLVADRGVPRALLCAPRRHGGTGCSGRRRWRAWVPVAGVSALGAAHWEAGRWVDGPRPTAAIGRGRPDQPLVPGWVVGSAAVTAPPPHQQTPGTRRERARRAKAQAQHRAHQQGRQTTPPRATAPREAQTWGRCTTAPTVAQAVAASAQRLPSAATFRDWHNGWGGRAAVVKLPTEALGDRLSGVVCLTDTLQRPRGQRVRVAPRGQQRRAQWTVTDRVRWFGCGQRLFDDPGYAWRGWLAQQWESLGQPGAAVQATPTPEPALEEAA